MTPHDAVHVLLNGGNLPAQCVLYRQAGLVLLFEVFTVSLSQLGDYGIIKYNI
jgi:hypothetical protein